MGRPATEAFRPGRIALAVPALVVLGYLSLVAVGNGRADLIVAHASREMGTWTALRPASDAPSADWIRADLGRAVAFDPEDPAIHELLGVLKARRIDRTEYLREAIVHFSKALELRPASPYSWANLLEAMYQAGDTGRRFEEVLERAARLGPGEPQVQRIVADFGLAVWEQVGAATRGEIEALVARGMRRNPLEILQISDRRGRLDVACRHVSGVRRTDELRWSKFCQSMEAIP